MASHGQQPGGGHPIHPPQQLMLDYRDRPQHLQHENGGYPQAFGPGTGYGAAPGYAPNPNQGGRYYEFHASGYDGQGQTYQNGYPNQQHQSQQRDYGHSGYYNASSPPQPPPPSSSPGPAPLDQGPDLPDITEYFKTTKKAEQTTESDEVEFVEGGNAGKAKPAPKAKKGKEQEAQKVPKPQAKKEKESNGGKAEAQAGGNGRKGVRSGTFNYTTTDDTLIVSVVREVLPIGGDMWIRVAKLWCEQAREARAEDPECDHPTEEREGTSLKTRFDRLVTRGKAQKPRTGSPERSQEEQNEIDAFEVQQLIDESAGTLTTGGKATTKAAEANTTRVIKSYQDKKSDEVKKEKSVDESKPRPSLSAATEAMNAMGSHFNPDNARVRDEVRNANTQHIIQVQSLQAENRRLLDRYDKAREEHMREVMELKDRIRESKEEVREERNRTENLKMELRMMQMLSGGSRRGRSRSRSRRRRSYSRSRSHSRSRYRSRSTSRSHRRRQRSPEVSRSRSRHTRRRYRSPSRDTRDVNMRSATPVSQSQAFHAVISPAKDAEGKAILQISATPMTTVEE